MKRPRNQKGFVLLIVIALIPLIGVAAIVLTSNSRHILTNTRRAALKTQAQLACESGMVWIETNSQKSLTNDQPVILDIGHEGTIITCRLERISKTDTESVFTVTGSAEDKRFSCKHQQQFVLKH